MTVACSNRHEVLTSDQQNIVPSCRTGCRGKSVGSGTLAFMEIVEVTEVDDALVEAFERLIPQLSKSNPPPSRERLQAIVDSEASVLLLAKDDDGTILGSMTLAMFLIPTGLRAWIEDVVVDEAARGKGVGRIINERAIEIAEAAGATSVDLTSRPTREAANRLYQRMGFEKRETNVYRYKG